MRRISLKIGLGALFLFFSFASCGHDLENNNVFAEANTKEVKSTFPQFEDNSLNKDEHKGPYLRTKWRAASYFGIRMGKSNVDQMLKEFGQRIWSGEYLNEDSDNNKKVLLYQFDKPFGRDSHIDVLVEAETKIITAITEYPNTRPSRSVIEKKFGTEYYEIESWESLCIDSKRAEGPNSKRKGFPYALVFPDRGMYLTVNSADYVSAYGYLEKCGD